MTFRRLSLTQRRVGLGILVGAAFALLLSPAPGGQLNGFSKHNAVARYSSDLPAEQVTAQPVTDDGKGGAAANPAPGDQGGGDRGGPAAGGPPGSASASAPVKQPQYTSTGALRRTGSDAVALTFDDGPDPAHTPGVLDSLSAAGVRATFFMLAERAEAEPALAARVAGEGHEVALHGTDHARLTRLSRAEVAERVDGGRRRLEAVVGRRVRLFRPPYGAQSPRTWLAARRAGLRVVVWGVDLRDWDPDQTAATIAASARRLTTSGAILLLHDGIGADERVVTGATVARPEVDRAAVTGAVLDTLAGAGWQPGTVGDLLAAGRPVNSAWFRP
jgi:peptidoglycan-N-acetylglucosamine deacetylase